LDLDAWVDAGGRQAGQQWPGAIGAITVGGGQKRWRAGASIRPCGRCQRVVADLGDQFGQQRWRGGRVADIAGGGGGRGDQLAVGSTKACPL
jgi:hypothetical protein